jgi:hypothetical protein
VLKFSLVLIALCNFSQNLEVNRGSRSDTMEIGTPCNLTISRTYNSASLSIESVTLIGRKWAHFINLSIMTHITSCLLGAFGRPTTKSITIWSHFHVGTSSGLSKTLQVSDVRLSQAGRDDTVQLNNIPFDTTPPKLLFQILIHLVIVWVNNISCQMSFIKDVSPKLSIIRDNCPPTACLQHSLTCEIESSCFITAGPINEILQLKIIFLLESDSVQTMPLYYKCCHNKRTTCHYLINLHHGELL